MSELLLKVENISKSFRNNGSRNEILRNLNAEIYSGDFTVIMGPSGAGKSTLLYALSAMDSIDSGRVMFGGKDLHSLGGRALAEIRAGSFGFVFQEADLVSTLTVRENIAVAGYADKTLSQTETDRRTEALLERLGLTETAERFPHEISGGEAQRAAVARAVVTSPEVVFADEPTGALNRAGTREVLDIFTGLNRDGQSIVMVTHDIRCALRGNRILYVEDGRILETKRLPEFTAESEKERKHGLSVWLETLRW